MLLLPLFVIIQVIFGKYMDYIVNASRRANEAKEKKN